MSAGIVQGISNTFLTRPEVGVPLLPVPRMLQTSLSTFISQQVTASRLFHLNLTPPGVELSVVCGGWEQCSEDYRIERNSFPYYSIEFVAAGQGELELFGHSHLLMPGMVFTYGPGIPHTIRTSRTERLRKYFVDFSGCGARAFLERFDLGVGEVLQTGLSVQIQQAFDAMIHSALVADRFAEASARLQLEMLLIWIRRGAREDAKATQRSAAVFERCRQFFHANFRNLRTVEEAADACHINVAYLTRLFRRFQDETPYRYLQRLQIQWAAERLQSSGCQVKAVADQLNMDPFQFSRMFKRFYGVSPSIFLAQRTGFTVRSESAPSFEPVRVSSF